MATLPATAPAPAPVRPVPDVALATRLEHAALNATAVREQLLYDGWLVRWAPDEVRRVRSVNVVAPPVMPFAARFDFCRRWYARHGLPMVFRIASHGPDRELDGQLQRAGLLRQDEVAVMARDLSGAPQDAGPSPDFEPADAGVFSRAVGALRGLGPARVHEHERRLRSLAVDTVPLVARGQDGGWVAAGLAVLDDDVAGLFDIVVAPALRRRGLGRAAVVRLLAVARERGARQAYLQVESRNEPARRLYRGYGFRDVYTYWYRTADRPA